MSLSFHKSILDACAEVFSILKVEKLIKFLDICPSLIFSSCLEHFPACLCLRCVFCLSFNVFFLLKFEIVFVLN